jgi:hypothetical protein
LSRRFSGAEPRLQSMPWRFAALKARFAGRRVPPPAGLLCPSRWPGISPPSPVGAAQPFPLPP